MTTTAAAIVPTEWRESRPHVEAALRSVPSALRRWVAQTWRRLASGSEPEGERRRRANLAVLDIREAAEAVPWRVATDDEAIRARAKTEADRCRSWPVETCREYLDRLDLDHAAADTEAGELARYRCPRWWRRRLREAYGRAAEGLAVRVGAVHRGASPYVSPASLERHRGQRKAAAEWMKVMEAVSDQGDRVALEDVAAASVANPRLRRLEMMTRIAGSEAWARAAGDSALFLTLTTPSRFHRYAGSGEPNPRYSGATPREAQHWLRDTWAKVRAALHRRGIRPYGVRVAEPHHDGTPHWHLLLWVHPDHAADLVEIARAYALADAGDEPGASRYRLDVQEIDPARGSATGYVAKYVSKSIDGQGVAGDLESGEPADEAAERVRAWASTWGIRQFQFVGLPPVGVWREARRADQGAPAGNALGEVVAAADAGDWERFMRAMGGPGLPSADRPVHALRVWSDRPGEYGEPVGYGVIGLEAGALSVVTRDRVWSLERRPPPGSLGVLGITVRRYAAMSEAMDTIDRARRSLTAATDRMQEAKRAPLMGKSGHIEAAAEALRDCLAATLDALEELEQREA